MRKFPSFKKLTPEQRDAVLHKDGPALVLAAPGSGKTLVITNRIARLLELGVDPAAIAAITFTNKAASEMKTRVTTLVKDRVARSLQVSTFHSLCAKLLRQYPEEFKVAKNYTILDEGDAKQVVTQAMLEVVGSSGGEGLAAVEDQYYPVETIRRLISNYKQKLWLPDDPEVPTDSKKRVFLKKVFKRYNHLLSRSNTLDFDDLILRVVRSLQEKEALRNQFGGMYSHVLVDEYQDTNRAQLLLSQFLSARSQNLFAVGDPDQCLTADTLVDLKGSGEVPIERISKGSRIRGGTGLAGDYLFVEKVFSRWYDGPVLRVETQAGRVLKSTYQHCFFASGVDQDFPEASHRIESTVGTDFGFKFQVHDPEAEDPKLVVFPYQDYPKVEEQLKAFEEGGYRVRRSIQFGSKTFDFIPAASLEEGMRVPCLGKDQGVEEDIIKSVTQEPYKGFVYDLSIPPVRNYAAGGVLVHNSIYAFRGADISNILQFKRSYPTGRVYFLQSNFRSVGSIAAVANTVIKNNKDREDKSIKTTKGSGEKIRCIEFQSNRQEAGFIASEIKAALRKGAEPKDFAILYRTKAQSRVFEEIFVRMNIPHRVVGALSFYNRTVVKDVIAYLKLLVNPKEDASFTRIYNTPPRGIGKVAFANFCAAREEHDCSLMHVLRKKLFIKSGGQAASAALVRLRKIFKQLRAFPRKKVAPLIEYILKWTRYQKYWEDRGKEEDLVKLDQLYELIEAAKDFDQNQGGGVASFLEWVGLLQEGSDDPDENKVKLMTCHAAKGLEFKKVYLVGVSDGLMPFIRTTDDEQEVKPKAQQLKDIEEERRIFFVAVTRAEEDLTISFFKERQYQNRSLDCQPSRFIEEAGETLRHMELAEEEGSYFGSAHYRGGAPKRKHYGDN